MALIRRNILFLVKRCTLRYSSDNSVPNFWEIVRKQWRTPRFQDPDESSLVNKISPSTGTVKMVNNLNVFIPRKINLMKRNRRDEERGASDAIGEEAKERGLSVVSAEYLVFNGAKVKFSQIPEWIDSEDNYDKMPKVLEMGNVLDGIDFSYSDIDFAGIKPLSDLPTVKTFYAQGCKGFDDYCLDHISAHLLMLEELDLRNCKLISSRGLGVLYRLKHLRKLQLTNDECDVEVELMCVLLEEHFPNIKIEGITYEVGKKAHTE